MSPACGEEPASCALHAAAISDLVVGLMSAYTGRGPTRAKTYLNDDLVTVVLRDFLTKGEQSLVANGRQTAVLSLRQSFAHELRHDVTCGVEKITGRRVIAFLAAEHLHPDVAIELLLLAPSVSPPDRPALRASPPV